MKIANFKGISKLELNFGPCTEITGANGTGKSSIYDAYLWALFEKNSTGDVVSVQPLDSNNEPIHKVDTSVEVILDIDGIEFSVKRVQREVWSVPRGKFEAVFTGNTQDRFINDVPYGVREFKQKLSDICPVDDWYMMSSIQVFMGLKVEERRARLQKMATNIPDEKIAASYPRVLEALQKGKTIDELRRQNKLTRTTSNDELDKIPARIDQLEKMRVYVDEAKLDAEYEVAKEARRVAEQDLAEHVKKQPSAASDELAKRLAETNRTIAQIESEVNAKRDAEIRNSLNEQNTKRQELRNLMFESETVSVQMSNLNDKITGYEKVIESTRKRWEAAKNRAYTDNVEIICPTCGQALPQDRVDEVRRAAMEKFNAERASEMDAMVNASAQTKSEIEKAESELAQKKAELDALKAKIEVSKSEQIEDATTGIETVVQMLNTNAAWLKAKDEHDAIVDEMNRQAEGVADAKKAFEEQTQVLMVRIRECNAKITELDGKRMSLANNSRIDGQKAELEERGRELAQIIANCDAVEYEIAQFKKRKITLVEEAVSSLFTMVKWKLYEQNITNDGEKEICQAIIDGKPYEQQNTATRINAGIDIIAGVCRGLDCSVPLFVDNTESVTDVYHPAGIQLITLKVVEGKNLTIL